MGLTLEAFEALEALETEATNACLEAGAFAAGASLVHDMRAAAVLPVRSLGNSMAIRGHP